MITDKEDKLVSSYKTYSPDDVTMKVNGEVVEIESIDSINDTNPETNKKYRKVIAYLKDNGDGVPLSLNSHELAGMLETPGVKCYVNSSNSTQRIVYEGGTETENFDIIIDKNGYLLQYYSNEHLNAFANQITIKYNCEPHEVDTVKMRLWYDGSSYGNYKVQQHMYKNKEYKYTFEIQETSGEQPYTVQISQIQACVEGTSIKIEPDIYINGTKQNDWSWSDADHAFKYNGQEAVGTKGDKVEVRFKVENDLDSCEIKASK